MADKLYQELKIKLEKHVFNKLVSLASAYPEDITAPELASELLTQKLASILNLELPPEQLGRLLYEADKRGQTPGEFIAESTDKEMRRAKRQKNIAEKTK